MEDEKVDGRSANRPVAGFGSPGGADPKVAGLKGAVASRNGHSIRAEIKALIKDGFKVDSIEDLDKTMRELLKEGNLKRAIAVKAIMHMLLNSDEIKGSRDSLNWFIEQVEGVLPTVSHNTNANINSNADGERPLSPFAQAILQRLAPEPAEAAASENSGPNDAGGAGV